MATVKKEEKLYTEAEVTARYPKEWVTVEVVTTDGKGYWRRGRVIAHGPTREDSLRRLRYWRTKHPEARIAHVFTGPLMEKEVAILVDLWTFPLEDRPVEDGESS